MKNARPKILIFCDYYLPGYKSGGGMRTLANMVDRLGEQYHFYVVTRDHDGPLDKTPYETIKPNEWNILGNAKVRYLRSDELNWNSFRTILLEINPDAIYLNSIFGKPTRLILLLKRFGYLKKPIILAPEGELSVGAISNKRLKKHTYLFTSRFGNLYDDIIWKVCSELEKAEVESLNGKRGKIFIAPNMSPSIILPDYDQSKKPFKESNHASFVFLSRFARKKNFKWFLELLKEIKGQIIVDVIAPIEDEPYWHECQEIITQLPANINVNYLGGLPYERAKKKLMDYHFFLLPTLGENFGHVFIEGLSAGCPIVASDRTPWIDLEKKGIGWDLPLENIALWKRTLKYCVGMEQEEYEELSKASRKYAVDWLSDSTLSDSTDRVLQYATKQGFLEK